MTATSVCSQSEDISKLRAELKDKEATISELSRHLDQDLGRSTRGRRKRGKTVSEDTDDNDGLRNEINTLYRQVRHILQTCVILRDKCCAKSMFTWCSIF